MKAFSYKRAGAVIAALFLLLLSHPLSASCGSPDGVYEGTMDRITMKGKSYDSKPATFEIVDSLLVCDFPQIGKMPGKIRIELPVEIHEDGTVTAEPDAVAGIMKLPMGMRSKLRLVSLEEASVKDGTLTFVLDMLGKFMGARFPSSVHFQGNIQK